MKNIHHIIFAIIFISFYTQMKSQNYYNNQWKIIKEKTENGQYKSVLPLILEIETRAEKENNALQLLKALQTEFSILNTTNDDSKNNEASRFFMKIKSYDGKFKGQENWLYQVISNEFVYDMYQRNSWRINRRTSINSQDISQLETWSKLDYKNYLSTQFSELVKNEAELKKVVLKPYKSLFKQNEAIEYFPSLFDYFSLKHLDFLKNEQLFTKNEIKVNQSKTDEILKKEIAENTENTKLYFQKLKLDYDCETTNCKNKKEQLIALYNSPTVGDYKVKIAEDIINEFKNKEDFTEALSWVNKVKAEYPKSEFLSNIKNLENEILQPLVNIKIDQSNSANLPIMLVANYKNTDRFQFNIYEAKTDVEGYFKYITNSWDKNNFKNLKKQLVETRTLDLPKTPDYKTKKTSFELGNLPSGMYVVEYLVKGLENQNLYLLVNDERLIYEKRNNRKPLQQILKWVDRNNGKSIANTRLEVYEILNGNQNIQKYAVTTDANGNFKLNPTDKVQSYRYLLVRNPLTNAVTTLNVNGEYYDDENTTINSNNVQFFLDRAIYRPGQIVYFKGIATKLTDKKETVDTHKNLTVILVDANQKEIESQSFTTNDFGSFNGSFTLPKGKLNGIFYLKLDYNGSYFSKNFRVEEYKRPNFEVEFDKVKDEYQYGKTVELKGKATSFSGVPLSNAIVNFEIKKQNIRYLYFWWYPVDKDNENSFLGSTKTNEKGEFIIKLDLKKDENLDGIQVDNYAINASVTDINGETQSAETNLKVASVSHFISIEDAKNEYFSDDNLKLSVKTKNYNNQVLPKSYHTKLSQIKPKERVFRDNFQAEIQDYPVLSKEDFVKKFPHDYFDKSEKKDEVEKVIFNELQQPKMPMDLGKLAAGKYKLEFYNIEGKDTIKTEKTFEVFDRTKLASTQKPFLKVLQDKTEYKRSEKAKFHLYSGVENALVNIFIQNGNGETQFDQKALNNGFLNYEIPLPKDENISALNIQFQLVAYNDVQTITQNVKITTDKKPLRIETLVFRDKLEPGQKEKWLVKILGNDGEKVNAELLASMYDQSLDKFAVNNFSWKNLIQNQFRISNYGVNSSLETLYFAKRIPYLGYKNIEIPDFDWFERSYRRMYKRMSAIAPDSKSAAKLETPPPPVSAQMETSAGLTMSDSAVNSNMMIRGGKPKDENQDLSKVKVRQNLNETAFFYPNLLTDKDGNVSFEFTSPEALTQWKVQFLAHTKNAEAAVLEKEVVTQKDFSITPNYPRFLREGDELVFKTKLNNLSKDNLNGTVQLQILDAFSYEDISSIFNLNEIQKSFSVKAGESTVASWTIKVPNGAEAIIIKTVAKAGNFSDGEQKAVAILPNRIMVTDAVPVFVKEGQTKSFVLENLAQNKSTTATNVSNALELTTNPIWEVIFALPSLKNDTNLSADVVFNKWFADVLASEIFRQNPKIKSVFDEHQNKGILNSNLDKNQELKQLLLEETPWVLDSKNEKEQMQKIARLFDANTMRNSISQDWEELKKLQNPDGGFSWMAGYPSSYSSSLYILKQLGKINQWLGANINDYQTSEQKNTVSALINFVDNEVYKYWDINQKWAWSNYDLDYLDTRNYWEKEFPLKNKGLILKNWVKEKAPKAKLTDFTFFGLHRAALLFNNYGLKETSKKLMTYLKETSVESDLQGAYWKQNLNNWGWYNSQLVNHAGALEAFEKIGNDEKFVEEMKIWLITQKEVSHWDSSRGTAEVIFTILNAGKSWTNPVSDKAEISWGGKTIEPQTKATGYLNQTVISNEIDKKWATVTIKKDSPGVVQGGLFWQYYEDLNKIKASESYISITKELYKKIKTQNGEELQKITDKTPLKIGDRVTVRMILNTDRPMEFIHLKDMRAAGFEPVSVLSGYQWKNNLGYYEVTKDASTNFYIEYMPKGKFVFEYDYLCNAAGTFSNGISTLQNYYAPQMNAKTQGTKIKIEE